MSAVFLVIFFYKEKSAFRATLIERLKMADKIAFGIIRTAIKLFIFALCLSRNYIAAAFRTLRKRYGFGIAALGEAGTGKEESETPQFFLTWAYRIFRRRDL